MDLFGEIEEKNKPPIDFNFTLDANFGKSEDEGMSLEEFGEFHATAHIVPYARELIANITTRSYFPTLNIGPINVVEMVKNGVAQIEMHWKNKNTLDI